MDSERALAKVVRRVFEQEIAAVSGNADGTLSAEVESALVKKLEAAVNEKAGELGTSVFLLQCFN